MPTLPERTTLLRRLPLFATVPSHAIAPLAERAEIQRARAGATIVREGDPGQLLYVVVAGRLRVSVGGETVLAYLGPGDFFGEMALLTGEPRSATVTAEEPVQLLALGHGALKALAAEYPPVGDAIEQAMEERRTRRTFLNEASLVARLPNAPATLLAGRDRAADIVLDDPSVRSHHARFEVTDAGVTVRPAHPAAEVRLNGELVAGSAVARESDRIDLGGVPLFVVGDALYTFHARRGIAIDARAIEVRVAGGHSILYPCDLRVQPGELVAIVGPSGAGKTTLLHTLLGHTRPSAGTVRFDGADIQLHAQAFRRLLGYVPQDDLVHLDLTVRESLRASGRLRLPADVSPAELEERVQRVIDAVKLSNQADRLVRRLSGGERKRASVALELLSEPRAFFLDEPTSGLDPGLDASLMELLRELANDGRTVILTTHATRNLEICDRLVVVSGGRLAYDGRPDAAPGHFGVDGFEQVYRTLRDTPAEELERRLHGENQGDPAPAGEASHLPLPVPARAGRFAGATEALHQFGALLRRDLRVTVRDRVNLALRLLGAPLIAFSLLLTFDPDLFALERDDGGNARSAVTLLYLAVVVGIFLAAFTSANVITREAGIYRRERLVNLSPAAYVSSKVVVLAGFVLVQSLVLVGVLFFRIELPPPQLEVFAKLFGIVMLSGLGGMGMALLISALSPNADRAATLVVLILIPQLIFAGSTVPRSEMSQASRVVSELTISKWGLELAGAATDLDSRIFAQSTHEREMPAELGGNVDVRVSTPFDDAFKVDMPLRWGVLAGFFVVFVAATYVVQARRR